MVVWAFAVAGAGMLLAVAQCDAGVLDMFVLLLTFDDQYIPLPSFIISLITYLLLLFISYLCLLLYISYDLSSLLLVYSKIEIRQT